MSVNGADGEPPARAAPPITDFVAGAYAAMGVCAALVRRARTGLGEEISTSLTDSMVSTRSFLATNYFATGKLPLRDRQRPRAGRAVWPVRGAGWSGCDRAVQRPGLFQAPRCPRSV